MKLRRRSEFYFPGAVVKDDLLCFPEEYLDDLRNAGKYKVARQFSRFRRYVDSDRERATIALGRKAYPPEKYGLSSRTFVYEKDNSVAGFKSVATRQQAPSCLSSDKFPDVTLHVLNLSTTHSRPESFATMVTPSSMSRDRHNNPVVELPPPPSTVGSSTYASTASAPASCCRNDDRKTWLRLHAANALSNCPRRFICICNHIFPVSFPSVFSLLTFVVLRCSLCLRVCLVTPVQYAD